MTQKKKKSKRRTQIKELPKEEKELSREEQKKVKGGAGMLEYAILVGSNKPKQ